MLANIVDQRFNEYAAARLNVVIEPSWHDNGIPGADQHESGSGEPAVEVRYEITLADAIAWANSFPGAVTLYLYDADNDPMAGTRMPGKEALPALASCQCAFNDIATRLDSLEDRRLRRHIAKARQTIDWYVKSLG
jgi:hypothetical protein